MKKLKLMTILGTRPEIIRLSEIIKKADKYFEHILVHTGQNWDYTLNKVFFDDLELREPDYYLDSVGNNLGETIGNIISKSYEILEKESKIKELVELEEAIELLEKSILDKAFRGKLGTQNKDDEPAIELLKKIL